MGKSREAANNDLLLVSQFSVTGALYTCRPDLVGFVNALLIASNDTDSRKPALTVGFHG